MASTLSIEDNQKVYILFKGIKARSLQSNNETETPFQQDRLAPHLDLMATKTSSSCEGYQVIPRRERGRFWKTEKPIILVREQDQDEPTSQIISTTMEGGDTWKGQTFWETSVAI